MGCVSALTVAVYLHEMMLAVFFSHIQEARVSEYTSWLCAFSKYLPTFCRYN